MPTESNPRDSSGRARIEVKRDDTFGLTLREARQRLNKNRHGLATEIGVTEMQLRHWENADGFPPRDMLLGIAQAYHLDTEQLTRIFEEAKRAHEENKAALKTLRTPRGPGPGPDEALWTGPNRVID